MGIGKTAAIGAATLTLASGIGLAAANSHAHVRFDEVASRHDWLREGKDEIGFPSWIQMSWQSDDEILQAAGPGAVRVLERTPMQFGNREQAEAAAGTFNRIGVACAELQGAAPLCSERDARERFERIDTAMEAGQAGQLHYVALANGQMTLADKTRYTASICNLNPVEASLTLTVRYDPADRRHNAETPRQLAPGECAAAFDERLRRAPAVVASASSTTFVSGGAGGQPLEWQRQLALSETHSDDSWVLGAPGLCYSTPSATCGGRLINNLAGYARAFATSLQNEAVIARRTNPHFPYTMGVSMASPARRDEFGVFVTDVQAGSVAEQAQLQPGDRIIRVGDAITFTEGDVQLAIDRHVGDHGRRDGVVIDFVRNGEVWQARVGLVFNQLYWDARGFNNWWGGVRGAVDSFTLGLAQYPYCLYTTTRGFTTDYGEVETFAQCQQRWATESHVYQELYTVGYTIGSWAPTALSLVLPSGALTPLFIRNATAQQLARSFAIGVIENTVTTAALAERGDTAQDIMQRVAVSMPQSMAVDAAVDHLPSLMR